MTVYAIVSVTTLLVVGAGIAEAWNPMGSPSTGSSSVIRSR